MNKFLSMIDDRWNAGARVCIGLDSEVSKLPEYYRQHGSRQALFNQHIVDATKDIALAYKPNIAFYPGRSGLDQLVRTVQIIRDIAPNVPIILDAKRADIGNTNRGYVMEAFEEIDADAVTVNPYFGMEAMKPFLERDDKGIIILCRTSNVGSDEFQSLMVEVPEQVFSYICSKMSADHRGFSMPKRMPMHQYVAWRVAYLWNTLGNCALVVGATFPKELSEVRRIVGDMPILAPGIGTQGGDVEKTVQNGLNSLKRGLIINSSSGIIFASSGPDFAHEAYRKTSELTTAIKRSVNIHT